MHTTLKATLAILLAAAATTLAGAAPATAPAAATPTDHAAHAGHAAGLTIQASSAGYNPPVATIASGTDVAWHSTDVSHVQRETSTPVGSPAACFNENAPGDGDSAAVTFSISGGALTATVGSTTRTCANAVEANGNFLLPYHCTLHPSMRGFLVVTP